ncbi:hypothetical protein PanWU01x14_113300, partial [Parasponia andersonii]
ITCLAVDYQESYETALFSIKSEASDSKGYFYVTLSSDRLGNQLKLKDCKAYLDHSPLEVCNIPTNVNNGILGYVLASYSIFSHMLCPAHLASQNLMLLLMVLKSSLYTAHSKGLRKVLERGGHF